MSDTLLCPHCNALTPSEYNYCVICDQQVKCKHDECGAMLVPGKTKCFKCGRPTDQAGVPVPQNTFSHTLEQSGVGTKNSHYIQKTEFKGSDFAVAQIAGVISAQILGQSPPNASTSAPPRYQERRINVNDATKRLISTPHASHSQTDSAQEIDATPSVEAPGQTDPMESRASGLFERDGEILMKKVRDFKGKYWSDQQRHFILLYIFAYPHLVGKPVPSKAHLKSAAEKAEICDPTNFTKYLDKLLKSELIHKSDGIILNLDGEKSVQKILADMDNADIPQGEAYWDRASKSETKRHRLGNEDNQRLEEWAKEQVDLGQLSIVQLERPVDYALLAVWLLTIRMEKAQTVRWNEAFYHLKFRFPNISVSPEAFSRCLTSGSNQKLFRSNQESGYFLSDEAQARVQGWTEGKPIKGNDKEK